MRVAERFEPGFGVASAVILGLGTMVLPLSTLLFSHVFTAFLGFAAFALMLRERDGPPRRCCWGWPGSRWATRSRPSTRCSSSRSCSGCTCSRGRDALTPAADRAARRRLRRSAALVGIVPLLLYNHYAFHSWTHLAYSDIPQQQKGFFGISAPSLTVLGDAAVRLARAAHALARC